MNALDTEAVALLAHDPYGSRGEYDPEEQQWIVRADAVQRPSLRFATIVGDVLHALRSALDHLVYEMARLNTGRPVPMTEFPIFASIEDYRRVRRQRRGHPWALRDVSRRHRAAIQRLQPYHRRDEACIDELFTLARLSNQDKHRLLHFALPMQFDVHAVRVDVVRDIGAIGPIYAYHNATLDENAPLLAIDIEPSGPNPYMNVEFEATVNIAFDDGWLVLNTLRDIELRVGDIIKQFGPDFG